MLPAAARMRHHRNFDHAVRAGYRATRAGLTVHLAAAPAGANASSPLVGFVVSRAVGPAVVRNRVRRRLRHVVNARLPRLTAEVPGADVVVRAAPQTAGRSSAELAGAFDRALAAVLSSGAT